jgi:hypothetical protein
MPDNNSGTPSRHRLKHIRIEAFKSVATFAPPKRKIANSTPDREIHGLKLRHELAAAFLSAHALLQARDSTLQTGKPGVYIEVESAKDKKLPDLRWAREDIRFGALRVTDAGVELGTMFVPESAEGFLARKAEEYSQQDTPKGIPKHEDIFAPIETFRAGTIESLWTDQRAMPVESIESIWWECWCWEDRVTNLELAAKRLMLRASECRLHFPELVVIPVYGSREQMVRLLQHTDAIEELRRATDTPTFFTKLALCTVSGDLAGDDFGDVPLCPLVVPTASPQFALNFDPVPFANVPRLVGHLSPARDHVPVRAFDPAPVAVGVVV